GEVGTHPDDGEPIIAGVGRFGPYVQHGKTYANLTAGDDVLGVGLNRAVALIEEKRAKGPRRGRFGADPGRALGDHPDKGGPIVVKNGRYGPYVNHDGVNATLPSDMTPDAVTLEQAVGLLDARAARGGNGKKAPKAAKTAASKTSANKTSANKAAETEVSAAAAQPRTTARKKPAKPKAAPKSPVTVDEKPARKAKSR